VVNYQRTGLMTDGAACEVVYITKHCRAGACWAFGQSCAPAMSAQRQPQISNTS